ncbi:adenylyl-sulfate kinase [Pelagibacterales bacterium SAG-MED05]|nr:adenylyl-sulfate kinase [Pelagibacterales bacterium SAG-MED05]
MKKKNKKKGILFWITGLSGAGKTSVANEIKKEITKQFGPTLVFNGDDLRKIFNLNKYDQKSRLETGKNYCKFAKFITDQNINLIFTVVGMFDQIRSWNKKNISNYVEIYLKASVSKIKEKRKKKLYFKKNNSIVGIQIKPQFPKKPNFTIKNDFTKSIKEISGFLLKKIIKAKV